LRVCYVVAPSLARGRVCKWQYNCFWSFPEQSLLGQSPAELTAIFYCLIWDSPNLEGQVPVFISPHEQRDLQRTHCKVQSPLINYISLRNIVIKPAYAALSAGFLLWVPRDSAWNCYSCKTTEHTQTAQRCHDYMKCIIQIHIFYFDMNRSQQEAHHCYFIITSSIPGSFCLLSLFQKNKIRLKRLPFLYLCSHPYELLNDWSNLHETWLAYHGNWAHAIGVLHKSFSIEKNSLPESSSELYRPGDRSLSAKLVPTFGDRGCRVVSATDPYGHILGFLDRSHYFFLQVAPQLYLSGPRSRLTTQKTWYCRKSNLDLWICSQELWPLDHRGGQSFPAVCV
jgi:hypothetical protein